MNNKSKSKSTIYWTVLQYGEWNIHLAATDEGLCYVGSPNGIFEEMTGMVNARFVGCAWVRDDERMRPYATELIEYLQGVRKNLTFPIDLRGTQFQMTVWKALCGIPYGQTRSYSDIASEIGRPTAVRAVGTAIGANPIMITVPCHRVIGKNGALTGFRGGIEMKTKLLQIERDSVPS